MHDSKLHYCSVKFLGNVTAVEQQIVTQSDEVIQLGNTFNGTLRSFHNTASMEQYWLILHKKQ